MSTIFLTPQVSQHCRLTYVLPSFPMSTLSSTYISPSFSPLLTSLSRSRSHSPIVGGLDNGNPVRGLQNGETWNWDKVTDFTSKQINTLSGVKIRSTGDHSADFMDLYFTNELFELIVGKQIGSHNSITSQIKQKMMLERRDTIGPIQACQK